jgi:hypothetical protein
MDRMLSTRPQRGDARRAYCAIGHTTYAVQCMPAIRFTQLLQILFMVMALICAAIGNAHATASPSGAPLSASLPEPTTAAGAANDGCAVSDRITQAQQQGALNQIMREASLRSATLGSYDPTARLACLDKLEELLMQIGNAIEGVADGFQNPIVAIVTTLAGEILAQLFMQLIENVRSAICSAADQIYNFIDSHIRNALCIPSLNGINPFDFTIDLEEAKCDGWSIDMLSGQIHGQPVRGMNIPSNTIQDAVGSARSTNQYMRTGTMPPTNPITGGGSMSGANPPGIQGRPPAPVPSDLPSGGPDPLIGRP